MTTQEGEASTMLEAALEYGALGWPVFPVYEVVDGRCSCRRRNCQDVGKHPRVSDWENEATTDPAKLREYWTRWPNANIGLPTGRADLFVGDLDVKPDVDGRETWRSFGIEHNGPLCLTPSGGEHLYYQQPAEHKFRNTAKTLGPGIDTRGVGGYVLLPPSNHVKGEYVWDVAHHPAECPLEPMPQALIDRLNGSGKAKAKASEPLPEIIPEGERNATLFKFASSLRGRGFGEHEIRSAVQTANEARGDPRLPDDEIEQIVESAMRYEPGEKGRPKTAEYVAILGALGYTFRINDCDDTLEVSSEPITDDLRAEIRAKLRDLGYREVNVAEDAYLAAGRQARYHPVKEYLNGLQWDGDDHIGLLTSHFKDRHNVFSSWFRYWLIGAVAKVFQGAQNTMLVLDGAQGIGKSYFVRWLCPLPDYFIQGPLDPTNKDDAIRLISKLIWEVGELGATMRRADREALKFVISREKVTVRKPYGRFDMNKPAMASLVGTLNNEGGFLTDPTGNRRFLVATLTGIDWKYAKTVDVHQVWAEAVQAYRDGEPWELVGYAAKKAAELNLEYMHEDPIENLMREHFDIDPLRLDWWTSSADILMTLQDHGLRGTTRSNQMAISATLTRLGIQQRKFNNKRGYDGIRYTTAVGASD